MADTIRCFIAVDLVDDVRTEVTEIIETLRPATPDIKWVEHLNLHFTLKFLGDVHLDDLQNIKNILYSVCRNQVPFEVRLSGIGAFPKLSRPRVLWIGLDTGNDHLLNLAVNTITALTDLGYPGNKNDFKSHLTIGRLRKSGKYRVLVNTIKHIPFISDIPFTVDHISLYKSVLTIRGPVYDKLAQLDFG